MTEEGAFGCDSVVEAVKSEGGLAEEGLCVVWGDVPVGFWDVGDGVAEIALVGVPSYHLETGGEGVDVVGGVVGVGVEEIVTLCLLDDCWRWN